MFIQAHLSKQLLKAAEAGRADDLLELLGAGVDVNFKNRVHTVI